MLWVAILIMAAMFLGAGVFLGYYISNQRTQDGPAGERTSTTTARQQVEEPVSDQLGMRTEVEGEMAGAGLSGERAFTGVSAIELTVANGEAYISEVDLPAGAVELSWTYEGRNGAKIDQRDMELRLSQQAGVLRVKDWRSQDYCWHPRGNVDIRLTLKHGPGVGTLHADHGNGTLRYEGSAAGEISLGNGTLTLSGEPLDDMDISLGNGEVIADWLLDSGQHAISIGNGSADITLRAGSNVELDATVALGAIQAPAGVAVQREHLLGASATGIIGDGDAELEISVGNGAVAVRPS